MNSRQHCVIANYIPHAKPRFSNLQRWYETYEKEITDIYDIFTENVNQLYPENEIEWNSEETFNSFVNFIFDCSSKYY
jgi:hypothetical protein